MSKDAVDCWFKGMRSKDTEKIVQMAGKVDEDIEAIYFRRR